MLKTDKESILILTAPRTGSTALGQYIQSKFGDRRYFLEPGNIVPEWGGDDGTYLSIFESFAEHNKRFVVKEMVPRFKNYSQKLQNYLSSQDTYKVCLKRRDVSKQIASFYLVLSSSPRKWHFDEKITLNHETSIDIELIDTSIEIIKHSNNLVTNFDFNYDIEIYYEDIVSEFNFEEVNYFQTPHPVNYDEIVSVIRNRM